MIATHGTWDPAELPIYFTAAQPGTQRGATMFHPYILVALNELQGDSVMDMLRGWIDSGVHVLLDSGIFWMANLHAKANSMTHDEALAMAPEAVGTLPGRHARVQGSLLGLHRT